MLPVATAAIIANVGQFVVARGLDIKQVPVPAGRSTRAAVSHQSQPIVVETRAVMHAAVLGRASERAKSWLARAQRKSIPPRKLERQEGGFRVGAVFIRSFGVLLLYKIRRYKAIENGQGSV